MLDREGFLHAASRFYAAGMLEGEAYREAPETKRFVEAWEQAMTRHERWYDMVKRIRLELPGLSVADTTGPRSMAALRVAVYLKRPEAGEPAKTYKIIVGLASVLVPYYHVYQLGAHRSGGFPPYPPPQPRPREGMEGRVADVLAKHIQQETGYEEFPSEYESIIVPEICVGNMLPGQATLLDALFDEHRDNIP